MPAKKAKGGYAGGADASAGDRGKVAELSKKLRPLTGSHLISIAVPAGSDLTRITDWLVAEQTVASAVKAPDAKRILTESLSAAKDKLKIYKQLPATGLLLFCGEAQEAAGKTRPQKIAIDFVPFKPIRTSLNVISTSFNLDALLELGEEIGQSNPKEEAMLASFLDEINRGTGKTAFGVRDTLQALQAAAVTTLIIKRDLELRRLHVRGKCSGEQKDLYVSPTEEHSGQVLRPEGEEELECLERSSFVDWIRDNSWVFGVELELVSGSGEKAKLFKEGYGGIGAMLRYRIDFEPPEGYE